MLNIKTSLHNVIKNTATMQNKATLLSALVFGVLSLSSCEDSLTDSNIDSSPSAIDLSRASATINQNNIGVIAKSMIKSLNQVNPALSDEMVGISSNARSASLDNCSFSGTEFSEITQYDNYSFDYELEFLDCQDSASSDRILGELSAKVILAQSNNTQQYSIDLNSQLKQTNQFGEITVSHLESNIEVTSTTSSQTFDLKVLLDGQGTYFVRNVSALTVDNQTHQWSSGHLVLTSAVEEIDIYVEKNEGLYFEFSDGSTQVLLWDELNAI